MTDSTMEHFVTDKANTRSIDNGELGMFHLPGGTITTLELGPGWRANVSAQYRAGTAEYILASGAGYVATGHLRLTLNVAGTPTVDLRAGSSFRFPDGSIMSAEVIGSENARLICFQPSWSTDPAQAQQRR